MQIKLACQAPGYLRLRAERFSITEELSYAITDFIADIDGVSKVETNYITGSILIYHEGDNQLLLQKVRSLNLNTLPAIADFKRDESVSLAMNFKKNVGTSLVLRYIYKNWFPRPISRLITLYKASGYVLQGIKSLWKGKITVDVLDGAAIGASIAYGHYASASSIMYLLHLSDILEEYTRQKTRNSLMSALSFQISEVWIREEQKENRLIPIQDLKKGDEVVVRTGSMIPVDGTVVDGVAGVNQASMTGESFPVHKSIGDVVFAGTVVTEGDIVVEVENLQNESRIQNILNMVEHSETVKSAHEAKAYQLANRMVPYSFLFAGLVGLVTMDKVKFLSALTVDYSCAIKLTTPISVISAISEASTYDIMVKGGKFLEAVAESDVIVFDKTGTLTNSKPVVKKIIPLGTMNRTEILRLAACLEEHYPHSLARAIVEQAEKENISHKEEHADVEYVVSHGVVSKWKGYQARIGSAHFLFDDNNVLLTEKQEKVIEQEGYGYSCIYLSLDQDLMGVICIQDPPRKEAKAVIHQLRQIGFQKVIMLTGDGPAMAHNIADSIGITDFYSEVLPENKAKKIQELQELGHRVVMVGDGVNDTPALAKADVSISLRSGSDLAREVADITLLREDLYGLVDIKQISNQVIKKIERNFQHIFAFNTGLLLLGTLGFMNPATSSLLHNLSTAGFGLLSTRPLLPNKKHI